MAQLHVIAPGMLTTIQDLGRWGVQRMGVSVAGPMDAYSHRLANALVGNAASDATLEVTLLGPDLVCDDDRVVAVTGGVFDLTIDGHAAPMNSPIRVAAGSRLTFGPRRSGARAYVGIEGGVDVTPVLGSRSTHVTSGMGGFEGRALRRGDRLPLGPGRTVSRLGGASSATLPATTDAAFEGAVSLQRPARLRVLPGPHLDRFVPDASAVLQASPYVVGSQSDRMGFRLEGAPILQNLSAAMISEAMPMGALQVPASGQPILLMADRQTVGGYPIVATVITADLGIAGQLAPGDSMMFTVCTQADALAALIAGERRLMAAERTHARHE